MHIVFQKLWQVLLACRKCSCACDPLQDLASYSGRLPERLSLGCGTLEYSATRDHDRPDVDALLLHVRPLTVFSATSLHLEMQLAAGCAEIKRD